MGYRDEHVALRARLTAALQERDGALRAMRTFEAENRRLRGRLHRARLGSGVVYAALGSVGGLLLACMVAVGVDNMRLLIPGALLGALFGGLHGLARDIG